MSAKTVEEVIAPFFVKEPQRTSHCTLATLKDGNLKAGYSGSDAKFFTHINYYTILETLNRLVLNGDGPYTILETGCAAYGTKSTLIWDAFVQAYGGEVWSVDLNSSAVEETNRLSSAQTHVTHKDSLSFLKTFDKPIDFFYQDCSDVDFTNPADSCVHHWKEFQLVRHLLKPNSLVLMDDTPLNKEWLDNGPNHGLYSFFDQQDTQGIFGKGSLVGNELLVGGAELIMHQYQMLCQVRTPFTRVSKLFEKV